MNYILKKFIFAFVLFASLSHFSQTQDTVKTVFTKGRWLTGLSGSINTNATKIQGSRSVINNFGINVESGKFIKNRLLLGGKFQTIRTNTKGTVEDTDETIYLGPFMNYYFLDSKNGSLFTSLSLGYVRYRQESVPLLTQQAQQFEISQGSGFGSILRFGYAYTMTPSVVFDLGMNLNIFRVKVNQELAGQLNPSKFNVQSSELSFSFGFSVILDKFFF